MFVNVQFRRRKCSVYSDDGVQLRRPRVFNWDDIFKSKENANAYGITRGAAYYSKLGKDGETK